MVMDDVPIVGFHHTEADRLGMTTDYGPPSRIMIVNLSETAHVN